MGTSPPDNRTRMRPDIGPSGSAFGIWMGEKLDPGYSSALVSGPMLLEQFP